VYFVGLGSQHFQNGLLGLNNVSFFVVCMFMFNPWSNDAFVKGSPTSLLEPSMAVFLSQSSKKSYLARISDCALQLLTPIFAITCVPRTTRSYLPRGLVGKKYYTLAFNCGQSFHSVLDFFSKSECNLHECDGTYGLSAIQTYGFRDVKLIHRLH